MATRDRPTLPDLSSLRNDITLRYLALATDYWELGLELQVIGNRGAVMVLPAGVDKAHDMLPSTWGHATSVLPLELHEIILVTVHPDHLAPGGRPREFLRGRWRR